MAVVLICTSRSLDRDLQATVLFRADIVREIVHSTEEIEKRLAQGKVALLCIHRGIPGVETLLRSIRKSPTLKRTSIVVFSEDDFDPSEVEVMEAGANAILRLPPGDDFNERVGRLIEVPARRHVRLPVRLQVSASRGFGATVPVLAQNISATGILFESNHSLQVGDEVSLALRFEETGEIFSAVSHVARIAGPNRYGARFTSITKGEGTLKKFLASPSLA
jgi:DNA-binding response OmpR family regulator